MLRGVGDGVGREIQIVLDGRISSRPLKTRFCSRPLGTTSISRTTISARFAASVHLSRKSQLELADAFGFEGELRAADAAGIDRDSLIGSVVIQRKPVVRLELKTDTSPGSPE